MPNQGHTRKPVKTNSSCRALATYKLQTSFSALVQPDSHVVQKFDTRKIYQLSNEVIFAPPFLSVSPFLLLNLARRQSYSYAIGLFTRPEIKGDWMLSFCSCAVRFTAVFSLSRLFKRSLFLACSRCSDSRASSIIRLQTFSTKDRYGMLDSSTPSYWSIMRPSVNTRALVTLVRNAMWREREGTFIFNGGEGAGGIRRVAPKVYDNPTLQKKFSGWPALLLRIKLLR